MSPQIIKQSFVLANITQNFLTIPNADFFAFCGASKGFITTFKAFIKPFEAPKWANQGQWF